MKTVVERVWRIDITHDDWLATMQILRGDLKSDQSTQIKRDYELRRKVSESGWRIEMGGSVGES